MRTLFVITIVVVLTLFTVSCAKKTVCDQHSILSFMQAIGIPNDTKPRVKQKRGLPFPVREMETFFKDKEIWHLVWKKNPFAEFNFSNFSGFEACFDKKTGIIICARFIPKPSRKPIEPECDFYINGVRVSNSQSEYKWLTSIKAPRTAVRQAIQASIDEGFGGVNNAQEITIMNLYRENPTEGNVHQWLVKTKRVYMDHPYLRGSIPPSLKQEQKPQAFDIDKPKKPIEVESTYWYNIDATTGKFVDIKIEQRY